MEYSQDLELCIMGGHPKFIVEFSSLHQSHNGDGQNLCK